MAEKFGGRYLPVQLFILTLFSLAPCYQCRDEQQYSERLFLKLLPDGRVSATFDFSTVWSVHPLNFSSPGNGECSNDVIVHAAACCVLYIAA